MPNRNPNVVYIDELCVTDPDSGDDVHVEVWKCMDSGGIFAIDSSFLEQVGEYSNPFTSELQVMPETDGTPVPDWKGT